MKKVVVFALLLLLTTAASTAFAAVGDSRSDTAALYGEYRIVIDSDNQMWTKLDWEQSGNRYAKEATLWHQFWRNGQGFQMVVAYETAKADSVVQIQRFTPQNSFKLSEMKALFPEIHQLLLSPDTVIFATDDRITAHFVESKPEITLGAVIKEAPTSDRQGYYTLISFNIVQEGRVVKNANQINADTLIREFVMERVAKSDVDGKLQSRGDWTQITNYFK
ncbi:MAG: hypothetical protein E6X17_12720 [Sporomusaceae bacterium]|nr:hypothetical protein [Sporomusaceae bacterium]